MSKKTILLGLTTTPKSDWRGKIKEIKKFNIKQIALFPTYLKLEERKELYRLLEETPIESIPHIHLRDDTEEWEMDYYMKKYQAGVFNIHANRFTSHLLAMEKYRPMIYLENQCEIDELFLAGLDKCAGICLDVSHWEDQGVMQKNNGYDKFKQLLRQYKIGCGHISAVNKKRGEEFIHYSDGQKRYSFSFHWLKELAELDYVKKYLKYLPEYISIELENSFVEQLKAKEYLEKMINK